MATNNGKLKALQQWCRRMTDGYRDVDVKDFTTSWRNGLAFCALIHRFRPDLIDYDSLSKDNVFENNNLAFTVGERELEITAYLEAADMVALKVPDRLSIITYVSQYYNHLHSLPQLGGPGVKEKTAPATTATAGTKRHQKDEPLSEPEPKKQPPATQFGGKDESKTKGKSLGDKCTICKKKVYLMERHIEDGKLYHGYCFRHSDLSPNNAIYARSPFLSPSLKGNSLLRNSPTPKSSTPISTLDTDTGRTHMVENRHGLKRLPHDGENTDQSRGSNVQKSLFPAQNKSDSKALNQNETGTKHSVTAKSDPLSKDRQVPGKLKIPSYSEETSDSSQTSRRLSPTPKFDARTFDKHGTDVLSSEKNAKDKKLPLILQESSEPVTTRARSPLFSSHQSKLGVSRTDNSHNSAQSLTSAISGLRKTGIHNSSSAGLSQGTTSSPSLPSSTSTRAVLASSSTSCQPSAHDNSKGIAFLKKSNPPSSSADSPLLSLKTVILTSSKDNDTSTDRGKQGSSGFITTSTFSQSADKRNVEPMDVDTRCNKVSEKRSETKQFGTSKTQPEETRTSLLSSLAHIRNKPSAADSPLSLKSDSSNSIDIPHSKNRSEPKNSSGGVVSSKITLWQTKDNDQKTVLGSASNIKGKTDQHSPRDILASKDAYKTDLSSGKTVLQSERARETNTEAARKYPGMKLGETVTITLSTKDEKEDFGKPKSFILSSFETNQKSKSANHETSWNKKLAESNTLNGQTTESGNSKENYLDRLKKKDNSKSGNVLNANKSSKQKTVEQPPSFTHVKLKKSAERNEQSKSAENVTEKPSEKSDWQIEAERRMAALREGGFVDPESMKSANVDKNTAEDGESVKTDKNEHSAKPSPLQQVTAYLRKPPKEKQKADQNLNAKNESGAGAIFSDKTVKPTHEKNGDGKAKFNLNLKQILKSEEERRSSASKPEKVSLFRGREVSDVQKLSVSDETSVTQDSQGDTGLEVKKKPFVIGSWKDSLVASPLPHVHGSKVPTDTKHELLAKDFVDQPFKTGESKITVKLTSPARPPPPKKIDVSPGRLSAIELQQQLRDIDTQLSELELRGRNLEDTIRSVDLEEEEDMMMEWFQLVTEKNDLKRQEADLIYISREQDLEDEQSLIESQLRYLLSKDESEKSFEEQQEEEFLIHRKVQIVDERNTIVDSMDEDRRRYEEEDQDIAQAVQKKSFGRRSLSPMVQEKGNKDEKGQSPKKSPKEKNKATKKAAKENRKDADEKKAGKRAAKESAKTSDKKEREEEKTAKAGTRKSVGSSLFYT